MDFVGLVYEGRIPSSSSSIHTFLSIYSKKESSVSVMAANGQVYHGQMIVNRNAGYAGHNHGLRGALSGRVEKNFRLIQVSASEMLKDLQRASRTRADITAELSRQRAWIDEVSAANATCRELLNRECRSHLQTRTMLEEISTRLKQEQERCTNERSARYRAEESLQLTRTECRQLTEELDHTQRKFQLVDSLVDVALLEEDSEFQVEDRSRQITDVILDLEKKMELKYQAQLQKKDQTIRDLEASLKTAADVPRTK